MLYVMFLKLVENDWTLPLSRADYQAPPIHKSWIRHCLNHTQSLVALLLLVQLSVATLRLTLHNYNNWSIKCHVAYT